MENEKPQEQLNAVPAIKSLNDSELINSVIDGETSAFSEIIRRYESKVAATILGMLGNCLEADDVGQEVFIRFYRSLNEIKRRKRRTFISFEDWPQNKMNREVDVSDNNFEKQEIVQRAIQKLDTKHRAVIVLRLIDGYSTKETAKILNLPLGTVLSRLARGQQKLKKLLSPIMEEL